MDETDLRASRTVATPDAAAEAATSDHEMAPAAAEPSGPGTMDRAASSSTAAGEPATTVGRLTVPTAYDDLDAGIEREPEAVPSLAAINGHPLHPMIVPLPIGAFVGAFLADVAYARTRDPFWARSARHLTDAGVVTGLLAGVLGATDFIARDRIRDRPEAWVHAAGNAAVLGLAAVAGSLRHADERRAAGGFGLVLSASSAALLGLTGWLGGELSYRHRIGVTRG